VDREVRRWIWDSYAQCIVPESGCAVSFDPNSPGTMTLDESNAQVIEEPGVSAQPQWESCVNGSGTVIPTIAKPTGTEEGDLLLLFLSWYPPLTGSIEGGGFTQWYEAEASAERRGRIYYRWATASEPAEYTFNLEGPYICVSIHRFSNVYAAAPVDAHAEVGNLSGSSIDAPSVTTTGDDRLLVTFHTVFSNQAIGAVAGMTQRASFGNVVKGIVSTQELPVAGATGVKSASLPDAYPWVGMTVALSGPEEVAGGNYYRWELSDGVAHAIGIPLASESEAPYAYVLTTTDGFRAELRFPVSQGGTGEANELTLSVSDFDLGNPDGLVVPVGDVLTVYAHPCQYIPTAVPPDPPDDWPDDPYPACGATLADIAAALDDVRNRLDGLLLFSDAILRLVDALYGPWTGVVGQAQEDVSGHLGQFVSQALRAMSNYLPTHFDEVVLAEGVTGDAIVAGNYTRYRVHVTTVPTWAGWRGGDPRLFEVNSRAQQLGWCAFKADDAQLDNNLIVWENQVVVSPSGVGGNLYLHLVDGVVVDVYGVRELYTPRLA